MAVALQRHHLLHLLGAEGHDPAHVVAGQIHEHHVFGDLLGVLGQFGGHAPVLGLSPAPTAGTGNGP